MVSGDRRGDFKLLVDDRSRSNQVLQDYFQARGCSALEDLSKSLLKFEWTPLRERPMTYPETVDLKMHIPTNSNTPGDHRYLPPWCVAIHGIEASGVFNNGEGLRGDSPAFGIALERTGLRQLIYYTICALTAGIGWLILFWIPRWKENILYRRTSDVAAATALRVVAHNGGECLTPLRRVLVRKKEVEKFTFSKTLSSFRNLCSHDRNNAANSATGSSEEQAPMAGEYDTNWSKKPARGISINGLCLEGDDEARISVCCFEYRCLRYVSNLQGTAFDLLALRLERVSPLQIYADYCDGVKSTQIRDDRLALFGPACVETPIEPLVSLILSEFFHPFYVFQMMAISLWLWDQYYQYAFGVLGITLISLVAELFETRMAQKKLRKMARFVCKVDIFPSRSDAFQPSSSCCSSTLVPGDVIELYRDMVVPCDLLIIKGSVVVNESLLTGESLPIRKTALPMTNDVLQKLGSAHELFGGTEILDVRPPDSDSCDEPAPRKNKVLALVTRTGFSTSQGLMMRSILYPPEGSNGKDHFRRDSYRFLAVLAGIAFIGFAVSLIVTLKYNLQASVVIIRSLDTFTNAVPPALPVTMTVGSTIAVAQLKRVYRIMCIAPSKVNSAGQVNTVVFDKTGTLTEEGMDLQTVYTVVRNDERSRNEQNHHLALSTSEAPFDDVGNECDAEEAYSETRPKNEEVLLSGALFHAADVHLRGIAVMALCHGLSVIDGKCVGDPLELELFEFTSCKLVEKPVKFPSCEINCSENSERKDQVQECGHFYLDRDLPALAEVYDDGPMSINHAQQGASTTFSVTETVDGHSVEVKVDNSSISYRDVAVGHSYLHSRPAHLWRIVRRFEFIPALQRMSAVVFNRLNGSIEIVCKGSPEQVASLCKSGTIPRNLTRVLQSHTADGMRVLGLAWKKLIIPQGLSSDQICSFIVSLDRQVVESSLHFCGLAVFANKLKHGTRAAVVELRDAGCRVMMATGDNALTAACVARKAMILMPDAQDGTVVFDALPNTRQLIWHCSEGTECTASPHSTFKGPASKETNSDVDNQFTEASTESSCPSVNRNASSHASVLKTYDKDPGSVEAITKEFTALTDVMAWLRGKDPRKIDLIVTGPALRELQRIHETRDLSWAGLPPGAQGDCAYDIKRKCHARSLARSRQIDDAWTGNLARELRMMHTCDIVNSLEQNWSRTNQRCFERSLMPLRLGAAVLAEGSAVTIEEEKQWAIPAGGEKNGQETGGNINKCDVDECCVEDLLLHVKQGNHTNPRALAHSSHSIAIFSMYEWVLRYCKVFARMSPDDKALLVCAISALPASPPVAMCGDGANDCAALRAATVGVSLSEKEASIAAPFTATDKSALSTVAVLRMGRAALVNSFQSFKYVALYAMLQLMTSIIMYSYGGNLSDPQFLWEDLVVALPLTVTMAWTYAANVLTNDLPDRHLVGLGVLLSIIGQLVIQMIFVGSALLLLSTQSWYERYLPDTETERFETDDLAGFENTVVFTVSNFQFIVLNSIMAWGRPWRKPSWTNWVHTLLCCVLLLLSIATLLLRIHVLEAITVWLGLVALPRHFTIVLAALITMNSFTSFFYERLVVARWAYSRGQRKDAAARFVDVILPTDPSSPIFFQ